MMRATTYAYAIGRIRALEPKLVTFDRLERMADAKTAEDALKVLAETEYGSKVAELASPYDYELMLKRELEEVYEFIKTITPDEELTDLFFIKHDVHNIKVLLKSKYLGTEEPDFLSNMGILPLDTLREALESDEDDPYIKLPKYFAQALNELDGDEDTGSKVDPQRIDVALDRAMYNHIFDTSKTKGEDFIEGYFKREVDLINIRSLLRIKNIGADFEFARAVFMPYGNIGEDILREAYECPYESLPDSFSSTIYYDVVNRGVRDFERGNTFTEYERLAENFLLEYVSVGKWEFMGIQPIVGYILAKENEIAIIRIIMVGKVNNIPTEKIRERLRDTYV